MNPRRSAARLREVQPDTSCPLCGDEGTTTSWNRQVFEYGSGDSRAELTVTVPVRSCAACEFEFLDEEAERMKHDAVCEHLGVLPPSAIRRIREGHGMTRAKFALVTGLGEASLNRWENGLAIQNRANDRYLRLLARPGVMLQLEGLATPARIAGPAQVPIGNRFRALEVTDTVVKEQESFRLRKAA